MCRRSSEDQVERVLESKLSEYSPAVLAAVRSADGMHTVREYLKTHIKQAYSSDKRLSTRFWVQFFCDFADLKMTIADKLLPPADADDEPINEELFEAIAAIHHANPARRTCEPLEAFLQHAQVLTKKEMFGLIHASMEGPLISRNVSNKLLTVILAYITRTVAFRVLC